ncbi:hypothetical protein [Spongiactinospora gelatinilytica]|nr:hypothetical protein [Spongiactinospora gelatinilytica]
MGRRSAQRAALAALAITSLAATVIIVARAVEPGARVTVNDLVILTVAIIPWTVAIIAWARRPATAPADVSAAADALAALVKEQWQAEARHRRLSDPKPIPVPWEVARDQERMSRSHLIGRNLSAFSGRSDDVPGLIAFFRHLGQRRLIITGEPGTGKTTLAVQMLLGLLDARAENKRSASGEIVPVPVLIPVSGWDTKVHRRLHDWLAVRLTQDYPALAATEHGNSVAARLAGGGHILPVLDGLDEMEPPARAEVIRLLNASLGEHDQLILTSRRAELADAITSAGRPLNAAAIISPLTVSQSAGADYLGDCLAASPSRAWQRVLNALGDHIAPRMTALDLWLIRAVYVDTGKDPAPLTELLDGPHAELRAHLLDALIPSLIETRLPSADPADHFRPSRRLDPSATRRYLTFLAERFPPSGNSDIAWWRLAGTSRGFPLKVGVATFLCCVPAFSVTLGIVAALAQIMMAGGPTVLFSLLAGLSTGVLLGAPFGMAFGAAAAIAAMGRAPDRTSVSRARAWARNMARGLFPGAAAGCTVGLWAWAAMGPPAGILFGLVSGFATGMVATGSWADELPGYAGLRLRRRPKARSLPRDLLRGMAFGAVFGPLCGLVFGVLGGVATGVQFTLIGGIMFGGAFGPVIGLIRWAEWPLADEVGTPLSSHRADRDLTLLRATASATFFALAIGATLGVLMSRSPTPELAGQAFMVGLSIGFGFGWVFGLVAGRHHAWLALTFTVVPLALIGKLPWRFMGFLDDAHRLGLLRAVGPVYQFRHAALHDHLAKAHAPQRAERPLSPAVGSPGAGGP